MNELQSKVKRFVALCFGSDRSYMVQHVRRFFQKSAEFAQACGLVERDASAIIGDVYSRSPGCAQDKCGDVMVSLATVCNPLRTNISFEAMRAVERHCSSIDQVRADYMRTLEHSPGGNDEYIKAVEAIAPWLQVMLEDMIANPPPEFVEACNKIFEIVQSSP